MGRWVERLECGRALSPRWRSVSFCHRRGLGGGHHGLVQNGKRLVGVQGAQYCRSIHHSLLDRLQEYKQAYAKQFQRKTILVNVPQLLLFPRPSLTPSPPSSLALNTGLPHPSTGLVRTPPHHQPVPNPSPPHSNAALIILSSTTPSLYLGNNNVPKHVLLVGSNSSAPG